MKQTPGGAPVYLIRMGILQFMLMVALVGVLLWAINRYLPMQATVQKILNAVVIVVLILYAIAFIYSFIPASRLSGPSFRR